MKITTVAMLAGLSMALTSGLVVATTGPGGDDPAQPTPSAAAKAPTVAAAPTTAGQALTALVAGPNFTTGETLQLQGRLGHATLAAHRPGETFLMLGVEPRVTDVASTATPLNLSIVIDRSRSMEGRRIKNAVSAARGMIRRLRDGDTVSVVAYNTTTSVLVPPTTITAQTREQVLFGIRDIEPRGHTCISCGVEAGMEMLRTRTGAVSRILLLSDGEANAGVRDASGFRRIADRAREMDASVSSIGVDVDYDDRLLFAVSQASNGRHYFVENPASLPQIFDQELESLVQTVAAGAEIAVELAPGVEVDQVFDRAFRREGNRVIVPMGTFSMGDRKTVLMRLRTPQGNDGDQPVADVRLAFDDLGRGQPGSCEGKLALRLTSDAAKLAELDPVVESRLARAETSSTLAEANELFASGRAREAQRKIADNRKRIQSRRSSVRTRAKGKNKPALDRDFDQQLRALEQAQSGFGQAQAEEPSAPAAARPGKAQVRRNTAELDAFNQ